MPAVKLLSHTPDPEKLVAAAARLCYSETGAEHLLERLDEKKSTAFLDMLASLGHESPAEHVSFTFAIEGVSRAFLAQITRHRIASYSVQSQRYVSLDNFEYIVPPAVEKDSEAEAAFLDAVEEAGKRYHELSEILFRNHIKRLLAEGVPEKEAEKQARKLANEDARFVLPNACETKMMVTMNARSLLNFFAHRCCTRAQWEIRGVADEMLRLVREIAPTLFRLAGPPCLRGKCPEGKMSCGRMAEMHRKYLSKAGGASS